MTLQLPKPVGAKPVGMMGSGRMGGMGGGYGRGGGGGGGYENGMGEMAGMGGMGGMSQMGMGQMGGMGGYGMGEPSRACSTVFHPAEEQQILQMKTSAFVLCSVAHTYMGKLCCMSAVPLLTGLFSRLCRHVTSTSISVFLLHSCSFGASAQLRLASFIHTSTRAS